MKTLKISILFLWILSGCSDGGISLELQDPPVKQALTSQNTIPDLSHLKSTDYADVLRVYGENGENMSQELTKITHEFGPSVINLDKLPFDSALQDTKTKPWSAWWYPKFETTLFEGSDSTLEKYDRLRNFAYKRRGHRPETSAVQIERQHWDPQALKWEGLCNAWALASLLYPEPTHGFDWGLGRSHVVLSPTDIKALVMKTFEGVPDEDVKIYGQKFTGDHLGWVHPDPFPDQFHRFIEKMIFERKEAFIMDHDAGVEIWNVPVYRANYRIQAIPGRDDAVVVRTWLYTAAPLLKNEMDRVGTKENIREYHYVLFGTRKGKQLIVHSGIWIKGSNGTDSRKSHPDYFMVVSDKTSLQRQSYNSAIENELVDRIAKGDSF